MTLAAVPDHVLHLPRLTPKQFDAAVLAAGTHARIADVPAEFLMQAQRFAAKAHPVVHPKFAASGLLGLIGDDHRNGPAHFLSVAALPSAVPTQKGALPWMPTPYTFEGIRLPTLSAPPEARIQFDGFYWLDGADPSRAFLDAMILQFGLEGPIFHWWSYPRIVLNHIIKEFLLEAPEAGDDARVAFIDSLVGADGKGGGRLIDLLAIAKQSFRHPDLRSGWALSNVSKIAWAVPEVRSAFLLGHACQGDPAAWQGTVESGPIPKRLPQELMNSLGLQRGIVASATGNDDARATTEEEFDGPSTGVPLPEALNRYIRLSGRQADDELLEHARGYQRLKVARLLMVFAMMRDHMKHWSVEEDPWT